MTSGLARGDRMGHAGVFNGSRSRHFRVLRGGQRRRQADTTTARLAFETVWCFCLVQHGRCALMQFGRCGHLVARVMRCLRALMHPALCVNRRGREQQQTTGQNHAEKDATKVGYVCQSTHRCYQCRKSQSLSTRPALEGLRFSGGKRPKVRGSGLTF